MNRFATAALLLGAALLPCGCIMQQQQQRRAADEAAAKPKTPAPLHLGSVHQVYPEQGFALLRIIGPMPGPGTTLITHPANGSTERIGNLCISSQQASRDGIVAADIRSGTIVKGDRVFRYRNIVSSAEDTSGDIIAQERPAGLAPELPLADVADLDAIPPPAVQEEEAPIPAPTAAVETTVLPTTAPVAPGSAPDAPSAPAKAPGYLDSIPDTIEGWDAL